MSELPEVGISAVISELRTSAMPVSHDLEVLAKMSSETLEIYEAEALARRVFEILSDRVWPEDRAEPED